MALRADDVNLGRDRELVELFQNGDGSAFEDLYRRYFQRIYRYCLKRVGDPHEAEEIAQEAFVRAYKAMPRLEGERRFYPWLSVIASRLCVDTHRRRGRTSPSPDIDLGVVDGGQEDVIAEVDREILGRALDRVAPRHREVLRLREEEGWTYDRIARHLEVRVGTVEALLFRARRALRREFHALAGADSRLASLPVIGYIIRRITSARGRFVELAGQAAPFVGAGAMSVAVVVGSVAGGGAGARHPVVTGATQSATPTIAEIHLPALAAASVTGSPAAPQRSSTPEPGAPGDAPLVKATRPIGGGTADEGRAKANEQPISVDLGVAGAGFDPAEVPQLLTP